MRKACYQRSLKPFVHFEHTGEARWICDRGVARSLQWCTCDTSRTSLASTPTAWARAFEDVTRLGAVPVVRRHDIAYHRAETVGDRLEVSTVIERGKDVRWLRRNDLRRGSELLAHAATGWVRIDPETRRPKRLPTAHENAFGFGEGE